MKAKIHTPAALTTPAQGVALEVIALEVVELEVVRRVVRVEKLLVVEEEGELLLPPVVFADVVVTEGVNAALLDEGLLLIVVVTRVVVLADVVEALAGSVEDVLVTTETGPAEDDGAELIKPTDNPAEPAWPSVPPRDTTPPTPRVELVWIVILRPTPAESVPDAPTPADRPIPFDVGNRDVEDIVGAVTDSSVVSTDGLGALLTGDEPDDSTDATGDEGLGLLLSKPPVKTGETDTGGSEVLGILMEIGRDVVDSEETGRTEATDKVVEGSETMRLLIETRLDGIEEERTENEESREPIGKLLITVTEGIEVDGVETVGTARDVEGDRIETERLREVDGIDTLGTLGDIEGSVIETLGVGDGIETETLREVDGIDALGALRDIEGSVTETLGVIDGIEVLGMLIEIDVVGVEIPMAIDEIDILEMLIEVDGIDDKMTEETDGIEALGRLADIGGIEVGMAVVTDNIETLGALIDVEGIDVRMLGEIDGIEALTDIEGMEVRTLGEIDGTEALGPLIDIDEITLETPDRTDGINEIGVLIEIDGIVLETPSDAGTEVLGVLTESGGMDGDRFSDVGIEALGTLAETRVIELKRLGGVGMEALGRLSDTDGTEVETPNDVDGIDALGAAIDVEGIDASVLRDIEGTDTLGALMDVEGIDTPGALIDVEGKEVEMPSDVGIEMPGVLTNVDTIEVGIPSDVDGMDALNVLINDEMAVDIDGIEALGTLINAEGIVFEMPDSIEGREVLIPPIAVDGMDAGILSEVDGTIELGAPRVVKTDGIEVETATDVDGIETLIRLVITEGIDVEIPREFEGTEALGMLTDVGTGGTKVEIPSKVEGIVILGALRDIGLESTESEPLSGLMEIDKRLEGNAVLGVLADTVNGGRETLMVGVLIETGNETGNETEGSVPLSMLIDVDRGGAEADRPDMLTEPKLIVGGETLGTLIGVDREGGEMDRLGMLTEPKDVEGVGTDNPEKTDKREVDAERPGMLSEEDGSVREDPSDVSEPRFVDEIIALGMLIEVDNKDPGTDKLDRLTEREVGTDSVEILKDGIVGVASEEGIDIKELSEVWGREGDNDSNVVGSDGIDVVKREGAEGTDVEMPNELNVGSDRLETEGALSERDGNDVGKDRPVDSMERDDESWNPLKELGLTGKDDGEIKLEIPGIPTDGEVSDKAVEGIEVGNPVNREDRLSEPRDNAVVEIEEGIDKLVDRVGRLKDEEGGRIPEGNEVLANSEKIPTELKDVVKEGRVILVEGRATLVDGRATPVEGRATLVEGIEMPDGSEDALSELRDNVVDNSDRTGEDNEVGMLREGVITLSVGRRVPIEGVVMVTEGDICGLIDTEDTLVSEDRIPRELKDSEVVGSVEGRLVMIEDNDAVVGDKIMLNELGKSVFDGSDTDVDSNDNPEDGTDVFTRLVGSSVGNDEELPEGRDTTADGVETFKELIVRMDEYSDIVEVESGMLGVLGEMFVDWSDSVVDGKESCVEGRERLDVCKDKFVDGDANNVGAVEGVDNDVEGMDNGTLDEGEINDIEGVDTDVNANGEDRKVLFRSVGVTGAVEVKDTVTPLETVIPAVAVNEALLEIESVGTPGGWYVTVTVGTHAALN
ncbi:MAG: hypothetical protein Q9157_007917 [Trypethelium eluteriae]